MNDIHAVLLIAVIAAVTAALRFLPFLIFRKERSTPQTIVYLGKCLPYAIMAMLVVYCFRGVSVTEFPFGLPELAAGLLVAVLHVWKRNTLLSIISGTMVYMLLIQVVFPA